MPYVPPTVADFKARFRRDFPFTGDQTDLTKVDDQDVTLALGQALINWNDGMWETQAVYSEANLLLSAHFLCQNLLASSQGVRGQGEWLANSKAVGNLSVNFSIPQSILDDPFLANLSKTTYGCQYLGLIAPRIIGNMFAVYRQDHAV